MKNLILVGLLLLATGCGSSSSDKDKNLENNGSNETITNEESTNETRTNESLTDTVAPIITLNGANPISIIEGGEFEELGATAMDDIDGETEVSISGTINTAKVGDYTIEYFAIDKSGNRGSIIRVIHVISSATEVSFQEDANSSSREENNISSENNISNIVKELNVTVCPTPPPARIDTAQKNYYLVSVLKPSRLFSDIDLVSGQMSMSMNDIPANKRGLSFDRVYNSYDNKNQTVGTFKTNYESRINSQLAEQVKSRYYFTAKDACERGWRDIVSRVFLGNSSETKPLYNKETTLCNVYTKDENNESHLRVSLLTKDIHNQKKRKVHTLTRPNGTTYIFYKKDNNWVTTCNAPLKIEKINEHFIVTTANGITEEYSYYGNLISVSKNNRTLKLFYNEDKELITIQDAFNQKIQLSYNQDRLLKKVKSYDGTSVLYEYNDRKQLVSIIYPDSSIQTYTYDDNDSLQSIINADNIITKIFTYDKKGRVIKSQGINDCNKTELIYADTKTKVTQGVEESHYAFKLLNSKILTTSIVTDKGLSTVEYNSYGYPTISEDTLGNITKTIYNKEGLLVAKTTNFDSPNEIQTRIFYDRDYFGKPRVIQHGDISTSYLYSTYGELLQEIVKATEMENRVTLYGYDYRSHKITTVQPNGGVISHEYDINGDKNSTIDSLGFITEFNPFDTAGRALGNSDINEINSTMTYDTMGRILSHTKEMQTTTYAYDIKGREITVTSPNGLIVQKNYDEHDNILVLENNKEEKMVYLYDNCGNLIKTEMFKEGTLIAQEELEYDDKNRVTVKTDALGGKTHYGYNLQGEQQSITDALNRVTTYAYNAQNQLIKETTSDGNSTNYSYNKHGQKIKTILPNGEEESITYDILGRVIKKEGIIYSYDISDNILTKKNSQDEVTTYTYDIANRKLTSTHTDSSLDKQYIYDQNENAKGKLTQIINSRGSIDFKYDMHGNLMTKTEMIDDNNFTIAFTYDELNRPESKTYPSGKVIEYTYVKDELTKIMVDSKIFIKDIKRNQHGLLEYTYSNRKIHQREYDLNGQLTKLIYPNYTKNMLYNAAGEITELTIEGEEDNSTKEEAIYSIFDGALLLGEYNKKGDVITEYIYEGES